MTKYQVRKIYLVRQKSLTEQAREEKSLRIKERFFSNFDLEDVKLLHLFLSIKENGEIDTSFVLDEVRETYPNIKTIVPRVNFEKDVLEHLDLDSETTLVKNRWGIDEPFEDELVDEREIDLVLVPLLCFDKRGFRVGYGKGFYDKCLAKCRGDCLKIGLSFFEPIEEIEDVNNFDVKLDYCITPERVWNFLNRYNEQ